MGECVSGTVLKISTVILYLLYENDWAQPECKEDAIMKEA